MLSIFKYHTWLFIKLINGVLGMGLLILHNPIGLLCLSIAVLMHFTMGGVREEAIITMAINRAAYIVSKMTDKNTPKDDVIAIFKIELMMYLEENKIKDADAKSDELTAIFKNQF